MLSRGRHRLCWCVLRRQEFRGLSRPNLSEMDKVSSVLRQVVRDWSAEGEDERRQCYQPIIDELQRRFPASGDT